MGEQGGKPKGMPEMQKTTGLLSNKGGSIKWKKKQSEN